MKKVSFVMSVLLTAGMLPLAAGAHGLSSLSAFGKHKVTVCHGGHTISIALPALPAHLRLGDTQGACQVQLDKIAPKFLTSSIASLTTTSAHLLFTTDENATASVYVSTTTPVNTSGTATAVVSTLGTSNDVMLTGLVSGTTYHVVIVAADASGNTRTSSELTFTTLTLDTTAPTFLTSSIGNITTSSADVIFTTDENTTASVYSSTSTPVNTTGTATVVTSLSASHDALLSGLTSGTPYHIVIVAADASGNTRTSSELTFTTL